MQTRQSRTAYLLIAPALILFIGFTAYPFIWSAQISLTSWDGLNAVKKFVGFQNYIQLFQDPEFRQSISVTTIYTVSVTLISTVLGFAIALMLQRRKRSSAIYRTIFFSPVVTATVAAAVVWQLLFDPYVGVIDIGLRALHLPAPNWLSDTHWALPAVIIVGIWKRLGFAVIVYAAGMSSLPVSCFEAADLDGVSGWQKIRYMTIPLMRPVTTLVLITGFIDAIQVFDHIFLLTSGGPIGSTNVMSLFLYNQGFRIFHLGYASAIGWTLFTVILGLTVLQWQLRRRGES
ncbi:MAG: sugar ABC transporter permease [Candidatus Nanopelagicaceae bacterium]|nr:sugar ABC transporter permease [Candidatus Nanopelagicaceae bacterium]